jgi:hypothetical protein
MMAMLFIATSKTMSAILAAAAIECHAWSGSDVQK